MANIVQPTMPSTQSSKELKNNLDSTLKQQSLAGPENNAGTVSTKLDNAPIVPVKPSVNSVTNGLPNYQVTNGSVERNNQSPCSDFDGYDPADPAMGYNNNNPADGNLEPFDCNQPLQLAAPPASIPSFSSGPPPPSNHNSNAPIGSTLNNNTCETAQLTNGCNDNDTTSPHGTTNKHNQQNGNHATGDEPTQSSRNNANDMTGNKHNNQSMNNNTNDDDNTNNNNNGPDAEDVKPDIVEPSALASMNKNKNKKSLNESNPQSIDSDDDIIVEYNSYVRPFASSRKRSAARAFVAGSSAAKRTRQPPMQFGATSSNFQQSTTVKSEPGSQDASMSISAINAAFASASSTSGSHLTGISEAYNNTPGSGGFAQNHSSNHLDNAFSVAATTALPFGSVGPPSEGVTGAGESEEDERRRKNKFAAAVMGPSISDICKELRTSTGFRSGMSDEPIEIDLDEDDDDAEGGNGVRSSEQPSGGHWATAGIQVDDDAQIFLDRIRSDVPIECASANMNDTVAAVRRLMRHRMHRCRVCKNRFVEKDLFERHLKEKHPAQYDKYLEEKAAKERRERAQYEAQCALLAEREEKRNQRIAFMYEKTFEVNAEREAAGLPPVQMEDIFPPKPPKQQGSTGDHTDHYHHHQHLGPSTSSDLNANHPSENHAPGGNNNNQNNGSNKKADGQFDRPRFEKRVTFKKRVCPQCPFCDKRYRSDSGMRKHIARKHPDCIHYVQCNKCYKQLRNAEELADHDCDLTWICMECQPIRNMVTGERLLAHKRKFHRGERSGFQCNECNRKFLTPRKLRKHQKLEHIHTRTYKCHFCEEHFTSELQVSLHERIHTGKIRYECNICDFRCIRYVHLTDHKREDHGYLCMKCGEKVMEWNELKYHTLERHEGYLCVDSQAGKSSYYDYIHIPGQSPVMDPLQGRITSIGRRISMSVLFCCVAESQQAVDVE